MLPSLASLTQNIADMLFLRTTVTNITLVVTVSLKKNQRALLGSLATGMLRQEHITGILVSLLLLLLLFLLLSFQKLHPPTHS